MTVRSAPTATNQSTKTFGPIVHSRGADEHAHQLAVVWVTHDENPGELRPMGEEAVPVTKLDRLCEHFVWRAEFALPARPAAFYRLNGRDYEINTAATHQATIGYVSCNGKEKDEDSWPVSDRNRMWQRLADHHERQPLSLLLHGGDQIYADNIVHAHSELSQWAAVTHDAKGALELSPAAKAAAEQFLFERYAWLYAQQPVAHLHAHVPSLMMWDDHDIMDGWGSHPVELLDSPIGQGLFGICKRMFAVFQRGLAPEGNDTFTFVNHYPDFSVIAPDLRTERRPNCILGPAGWQAVGAAFETIPMDAQVMLMSSVPLLGPRLSWLERVADWIPGAVNYKDDLRDQWQSRSHRSQWQQMLALIETTAINRRLTMTALSGEIHVATQASMPFSDGSKLTQFVASGIAHPPPPIAFSRALGWLATLGEDPVPGQPISIEPLPGQRKIYTAQRNFLLLTQDDQQWEARWVLEQDGPTPAVSWAQESSHITSGEDIKNDA